MKLWILTSLIWVCRADRTADIGTISEPPRVSLYPSSINVSVDELNSAVCPSGCRPLISFENDEISGEFDCEVPLANRESPGSLISDSIQRSLVQPLFGIDLEGSYYTNSVMDGRYLRCGYSEFPYENMLLKGGIDCDRVFPYLCVCNRAEPEDPYMDPIKIRSSESNFSQGRVGYDGGILTIYVEGWYLTWPNRTYRYLMEGEKINGTSVEFSKDSETFSFFQIDENGDMEHEIGDRFGWNGTAFVSPKRTVLEIAGNGTFASTRCGPISGEFSCLITVSVNETVAFARERGYFFVRDMIVG